MMPETPAATPGAVIWVGITQGKEFGSPAANSGIPNNLPLVADLAGQSVFTVRMPAVGGFARFNVVLSRPGIAVLVSESMAERRTLANGDVERYLRSMYATDDIWARWSDFPKNSAWRELLNQRLRTYVRVGQPTADDRNWATGLKTGVDVIPLADPTTARENEDFAVRVTRDGEAFPGCTVSFLSSGETREHVEVTDADGRAVAPLDARGRWLIRAIELRRASAPDYDWTTDVVGMTIYVP